MKPDPTNTPSSSQDLKELENYLRALVSNQSPEEPHFSEMEVWQTSYKLLESIRMYLNITRQSMSDREQLYDDMESRLLENQKRLYDTETSLKQNQRKLKRSEYKVLEYMLALQHINFIQHKVQGQLNIESLLQESTALLVSHLCAHRGFFLRIDLHSHSTRVLAPVNCIFESGQSLSGNDLLILLKQEKLDVPPELGESNELTIPMLQINSNQSPFYGVAFQSALIVPVWIEQELWGALCLFDKEERFGPAYQTNKDALAAFGESDQLVLQNVVAFLQKDLRNAYLFEMATVDSLSQLYVRRYFEGRLEDEIRRAQRHPFTFSLLMLDIDFFKRVNDTYGHLVGDEVIQTVAETLKEQLRQGIDLPARYGGEEMVVMLSYTTHKDALMVAERIRYSIEQLLFDSMVGTRKAPHITVSIGVSSFPEHANSVRGLIECADQALYQAKHSGRNQVCAYQAES